MNPPPPHKLSLRHPNPARSTRLYHAIPCRAVITKPFADNNKRATPETADVSSRQCINVVRCFRFLELKGLRIFYNKTIRGPPCNELMQVGVWISVIETIKGVQKTPTTQIQLKNNIIQFGPLDLARLKGDSGLYQLRFNLVKRERDEGAGLLGETRRGMNWQSHPVY